MQRLQNPFPLFLNQRGDLLDAGYVYVGEVDDDPETAPVAVYWDAGATQVAAQPLRTRGGVIVNDNGAPALVFAPDDYSMRVRDADGDLINYVPSASATGGVTFQAADDDLTAIAALTTTSYGRGALEVANAAALRAYAGVVDSVPKTGGTVTGNILRSGAGPHLYHMTGAFASGRVFATADTAADPTSQNGDIWLKYS